MNSKSKNFHLIIKCAYCGATIFPSEKYPSEVKLAFSMDKLVCPVCGHKISKIHIDKIEVRNWVKKGRIKCT